VSADPIVVQVSKDASAAVPDIANLLTTFDRSRLADQVNRPVQTALNQFLSQYMDKGVTVEELSVKKIVERLLDMSGIVCWGLAQPPRPALRVRISPVEEMAMKQFYYEAMPAKCAEHICTQGLDPLPLLDDWDRHGPASAVAVSGLVSGASPRTRGSASLRRCRTVEQVGSHHLLYNTPVFSLKVPDVQMATRSGLWLACGQGLPKEPSFWG
jgi:hypothetical protein